MAVCLLYLVSGLAGTVSAEHTQVVETTNITYINGDWLINDSQNRTNETIVLTGNLVVGFGGNLTFRNVTLMMNSTSDGQYQIEVQNGGTMNILDLDDDNTTTTDASNITSYNPNYEYIFRVRDGASFIMNNSELHECGYGPFLSLDNYGLYIQTSNAILRYNFISQCYYGIILYNSDAILSNNTIEWCDTGIMATAWSNGTIENNIISWSNTYGIWVHGVNNINPQPSNPLVKNNYIMKTGRDVLNKGVGIQILNSCRPIIRNTTVDDWGEDGMFLFSNSAPTIDNIVLDGKLGNYGIVGGGSNNWVNITNGTISNCMINEMALTETYVMLTNVSFDPSEIAFGDSVSNLTAHWFLHTYINDTKNNPILNVTIRIYDNSNGTYDWNFTTGTNGRVDWAVLREYYQTQSTLIDYSPYNITVSKPGYSTGYAEIEMNQSRYISFTLQDIQPPEINHTPVASANIGQPINITANITDNAVVDAVYLNYTGVNSTNYNVSMNKWNGNWSCEIPGQSNKEFVDYFIWCNDTSGNANMTNVYQIQIQDVTDPEINHTPVVSANVLNSINITANVTDDLAVNQVFLNYTGINGTNYNVSMNQWNGNWSFEIPGQTSTGIIEYFIWANDTSDNDNMTTINQIQISDITEPKINHAPVLSKNIGEAINITANITDEVGVNIVYLNYTDVHGVNQNITMNKWNGNYSLNIPGQSNSGFVSYFIWANDSSDNDNRTIIYQIQIFDITDPEINHVPVTSSNISEVINITANITDDVSVNSVYLNYTGVNGINYNVSMNKLNENYSYEISGQDTIGTINYFIWTNDSDGNDNQTQVYQIQILDVVKPEIEHSSVTSANVSETINITAQITDDIEVDSVYLNYTGTDGLNHNVSMDAWNGNWSYDIPGQASAGVIEYFIWANDTSGNSNLTGIYQVQINEVMIPDTTPPIIISKSPIGINVSITTTITITFNESMDTSSVQSAITISPAIQISGYSWNVDNTALTITPSGNLSYNTTYNVTIEIGAKDIAGNALENQDSWAFTTELQPITTGPDDGGIGEYWWIIVIIVATTMIGIFVYWQSRKNGDEEEPEEEIEEKSQE
jgi:hypothetical protein